MEHNKTLESCLVAATASGDAVLMCDNGSGFNQNLEPRSSGGYFGPVGRKSTVRIRGKLTIAISPKTATLAELIVQHGVCVSTAGIPEATKLPAPLV